MWRGEKVSRSLRDFSGSRERGLESELLTLSSQWVNTHSDLMRTCMTLGSNLLTGDPMQQATEAPAGLSFLGQTELKFLGELPESLAVLFQMGAEEREQVGALGWVRSHRGHAIMGNSSTRLDPI